MCLRPIWAAIANSPCVSYEEPILAVSFSNGPMYVGLVLPTASPSTCSSCSQVSYRDVQYFPCSYFYVSTDITLISISKQDILLISVL